MKLTPLLLTASLAANAILLAVFATGAASKNSSSPRSPAPRPPALAPAAAAKPEPTLPKETWEKFTQPEDIAATRARLEAEGFPPAVVRALLEELVRMQFAPRRVALNLKANEVPFWINGTYDPKVEAQRREINLEQEKATKALLGPAPVDDDFDLETLKLSLPNFSAEKLEAIAALQRSFNEKRSEAMVRLGNTISYDSAKAAEVEKQFSQELARVLSPADYEAFQLRLGTTANSLRSQLALFDASEQEFLALYQLRESLNASMPPSSAGRPSEAEIRARADAQRQYEAQVKAALGDARYAEYQRATDYSYRQATQLVARLGLPTEAAGQVYAVQKDLQQRMATLRSDPQQAPAARNEQLAALATEAEMKLTATLGARGFEAYKSNGGQWLQTIRPRATAAPPGN